MQQNMGNPTQSNLNPLIIRQFQDTISDCLNCHNVCMDRAMSALDSNQSATHTRVLLDCAEICTATAHSMMRKSEVYGYICNACQLVCTHCADLCDKMGDSDCANACRTCAHSCQQILKMIS